MLHVDSEQVRSLLFQGAVGLEKESLRITTEGRMAHTPHPFPDHPNITMDFSENQIEINTPVFPAEAEAVASLGAYTDLIKETLAQRQPRELLWPFSNPPHIEDELDIPIAQFHGKDRCKTAYREHLSRRYGRYKMTFCGIHVNYSFAEELLQAEFALTGETDYETFKNRFYLELAEQAAAYSWILTALTAASPVLDGSYVEKGRWGEDVFTGLASVRSSEVGYWNYFTPIMNYADLDGYADRIRYYVEQGVIQAPSELYYPVRLKPAGSYDLDVLKQNGVDHIELRMFDLNPLCREGLDVRDVTFTKLLLIYLAAKPRLELTVDDQVKVAQNFKSAAHYDLERVKILSKDGEVYTAAEAGQMVLDDMKAFYGNRSPEICDVLEFEENKFRNPQARYAWILRETMAEGFVRTGLSRIREKQQADFSQLSEK